MQRIKDHQVEFIEKDLEERGLFLNNLKEDIVDYVCEGTEREMGNGHKFMDAYSKVLKDLGSVDQIQSETIHTLSPFSLYRNFFHVSLRNLKKHLSYTLINVLGLSLGLLSCILIFLYVDHELSFDQFHEDSEQIFRVTSEITENGDQVLKASSPGLAAKYMSSDIPEIEYAARIGASGGWKYVVHKGNDAFIEPNLIYADPEFLQIFSFEFLSGDSKNALNDPFSMVITESTAKKYFGNSNPINEVLTVEVWGDQYEYDYTIRGVIRDYPVNSHAQIDIIIPFTFFDIIGEGAYNDNYLNGLKTAYLKWETPFVHTYVKLTKDATIANIEDQFYRLVQQHQPTSQKSEMSLHLQPVTDIYLEDNLKNDEVKKGNKNYIWIFSSIALLILVIACINFMNLSTAKSSVRAKEVGLRKVLGADRQLLISQFLIESVIIAFSAFILALIAATLLFPLYSDFVSISFDTADIFSFKLISIFSFITLLVGILSGSYPAFLLSGFLPLIILKGLPVRESGASNWLRKGLVVTQFSISIILIFGTLIISDQMAFVQDKSLGFDKENILLITIRDETISNRQQEYKTAFSEVPGVLAVSASFRNPGESFYTTTFSPEGHNPSTVFRIPFQVVDYDYFETLGINISEGRNFSQEYGLDDKSNWIINQAAANLFGWDQSVGKTLKLMTMKSRDDESLKTRRQGKVVGVVEDFHFKSLHHPIEPMIFYTKSSNFENFVLKIEGHDPRATIEKLESKWTSFQNGKPFEYRFLSNQLNALYIRDTQSEKTFKLFAIVAIVIASLGLFGLATFSAARRTREVGIRKVLGASVNGIIVLFLSGFTRLILLALVIAWPISYYLAGGWLEDFVYRTNIGVMPFIVSAIVVLSVAIITVLFHVISVARTNPCHTLRSE